MRVLGMVDRIMEFWWGREEGISLQVIWVWVSCTSELGDGLGWDRVVVGY